MTKTENTINLYDAKQVLEKTFADAARTIWNEIADAVEEHGPHQTIEYLQAHTRTDFMVHRVTSRSTSTISNILDDMKFKIYIAAAFAIREEAAAEEENGDAEGEEIAEAVAKHIRAEGRRYAANI